MAGIRIKISATEAKAGAAEVNKAFDSMAEHAVKTVKAVDGIQRALQREREAIQANLKTAETRFQAFAATVGLAVNKVRQSLASLGAGTSGIGAAIGGGLQAAAGHLRSFGSAVTAAAGQVKNSFDAMKAGITTVKAAFAGIVSALALRQLNQFAQEALNSTGALVDTADRIGLTVEQLQELQFAAAQSGVGVEQFASAMQTFSRRLSEATSGTGAARKTVQELGLDAKALAQDPAQALITVADKIAGISNQARRLEVSREFFAGAGAEMVNMLQQGGPAIDALRQKLRDLGGVMAEDTARSAEELGDRLEAVTTALGTQFKTALVELSPLLIKLAESLATAAKHAREFFSSFSSGEDIVKRVQLFRVTQQIANLQQQVKEGRTGLFASDQTAILAEIERLEEVAKRLRAALAFTNVEAGSSTAAVALRKVTEATTQFTEEQIKAAEQVRNNNERLKEHGETLNLSGEALARYHRDAVLKATADKALAEETYKLVLADERAKKAKEDGAEATRKKAEADREAEQLAKAIDADRIKREEFLADLIEKRKIRDQEAAAASAKNLQQLQAELVMTQEEGRLINASLAPKEEVRRIELEIAKARIEREAATQLATDGERQLSEAEKATIQQTKEQAIANLEAKASFDAMAQSIEDAALTTADLRNLTAGLFEGENIGDLAEDLGKSMGRQLIDGVLFGKGQNEKAILGNFNQLLGVDAAGLFGAQGLNLGNTLISSILDPIKQGGQSLLQSAGIDLGGIFGSSFSSSASQQAGGMFQNVVAGGSSTAASAGTTLGTVLGSAAAGAAGLALGKGLAKTFGVGGGASGPLGTAGGIVGGIAGGLAGGPLGAALGGAAGSLWGSFIGSLFASRPSKGTEIRKGVKEFLKDIEVSFASEIDSGNYFFEETKKLAKKMFGGDGGEEFLQASKVVLNDKIGPELAKQLQALGAFVTAEQARKLGKSVEQTGTTFGNLLLDNLGLDPETIDSAIQEIIQKANISFEALVTKMNNLFDKDKIGLEFFQDAIMGAVEIFNTDLPEAINVSAIALKSFGEDGLFDLEKFQTELQKVTSTFEVIVNSFIDVVKNAKPGEDIGKLIGEQIQRGLGEVAIDAFLADFVNKRLFEGIDLSDGLGTEELELVKQRARDAATEVDKLREAFGIVGEEVEKAEEKVEDLFATLRDLTRARFQLRLDVIGDLESIGALSGVDAARANIGAQRGRLAGLGTGTRTDFTDAELAEGLDAIRALRQATVNLFQEQEKAAQAALQKRVQAIQSDFAARQSALQREAQAAQAASEERIRQLGVERDAVQELYQARIDALQEELQIAEDFRRVAQSLQQTINGLVQTASPFSQQEQFAVFARQAAELRQRIAGATQEQRPELIQQLSEILSQQLSLGKGFMDPTAFAALFNNIVGELERLRDQSAAEGNRVESIQAEIAATNAQMEVQLRSIDARIEQARVDAQNAQLAFQQQAEELSRQEQAAIDQATADTEAEIAALREAAVVEIRNLALIEDAILAAQQERVQQQIDLSAEQVSLLRGILDGIYSLENSLITAFSGVISAQRGYDGMTTRPQLFLAHGNEHVKITPGGRREGPISVTVNIPLAMTGADANPAAAEEAIIQAVADDIRKGGKIRTALRGGR